MRKKTEKKLAMLEKKLAATMTKYFDSNTKALLLKERAGSIRNQIDVLKAEEAIPH